MSFLAFLDKFRNSHFCFVTIYFIECRQQGGIFSHWLFNLWLSVPQYLEVYTLMLIALMLFSASSPGMWQCVVESRKWHYNQSFLSNFFSQPRKLYVASAGEFDRNGQSNTLLLNICIARFQNHLFVILNSGSWLLIDNWHFDMAAGLESLKDVEKVRPVICKIGWYP